MTCPTCKKKIHDPYELEGIEYCCPNCAYNRDEKDFWYSSFYEKFKKHDDEERRILNQIIENKRLSSNVLFHQDKPKPIKAYAIVKNNKIDVLNIYKDKDVVLNKDEKLVLVEIKVIKQLSTA